jgi:hypothetical protein
MSCAKEDVHMRYVWFSGLLIMLLGAPCVSGCNGGDDDDGEGDAGGDADADADTDTDTDADTDTTGCTEADAIAWAANDPAVLDQVIGDWQLTGAFDWNANGMIDEDEKTPQPFTMEDLYCLGLQTGAQSLLVLMSDLT